MGDFSLSVRRKGGRIVIAEYSVHIPFDVPDIAGVKDFCYRFNDKVLNLRA